MADREKLIGFLDDIQQSGVSYEEYERYGMRFQDTVSNEEVASHLISHGVTVRERGRWHLEAHEENANFRWNVTAECPYCHSEKKEIWAGFFPGFPKTLAEYYCLESAKTVKLSNFCPNCGADMR